MEDKTYTKQPEVFESYDDGFIVRAMTPSDAQTVENWVASLVTTSRYDLHTALKVFPTTGRGFYIGEYEGAVVASCIRIPWGNDAYYGSYYYVREEYRGRGFGTRMRDQVAYGHVLEANGVLCIDAVEGTVTDKNEAKFSYVKAFVTMRYGIEAKDFGLKYNGKIVQADSVPFDQLISFDNKHFISKDYPVRRKFLQEWIKTPGGAAAVALNGHGQIVAFGQRRPSVSFQPRNHFIGPLYGDDIDSAMAVLQHLCSDVLGDRIFIQIWKPNTEGVKMIESLGFQKEFDITRMHANGDICEYKRPCTP